MTALMLTTEIVKRPVVTLAGEAVAQVKDTVFEGPGGRVVGFTLSGGGLFSGPLKRALPWPAVTGLGSHAVMIRDEDVFEDRAQVADRSETGGGNVLGSRVLTDTGTDLGRITDVVIEVSRSSATAVGYAIASTEALGHHERTVFIPLSQAIAVSGEALVVPALAAEFVAEDLPGFTEMMQAFHTRLAEA